MKIDIKSNKIMVVLAIIISIFCLQTNVAHSKIFLELEESGNHRSAIFDRFSFYLKNEISDPNSNIFGIKNKEDSEIWKIRMFYFPSGNMFDKKILVNYIICVQDRVELFVFSSTLLLAEGEEKKKAIEFLGILSNLTTAAKIVKEENEKIINEFYSYTKTIFDNLTNLIREKDEEIFKLENMGIFEILLERIRKFLGIKKKDKVIENLRLRPITRFYVGGEKKNEDLS